MQGIECPFQFLTASYLVRTQDLKATTLAEFATGLEKCSDASIFFHTFQSLSRHHFLTEGFSNDFAQWVLAASNRPELAEQLASFDIREYTSLAELRADLRRVVNDFCEFHPQIATQQTFEAFAFCEAVEVAIPLAIAAGSLREFNEGLQKLSHASLYFHFIASRLRLHLSTNDFSHWFENSLGLTSLARRADHIDIYTNTLEGVRTILTQLIEKELCA
ncbi:MAG: DUF5752 family protein [Acidobacteriota bacterium]|nr:DUF5752 family protein [Acidobacteriota bacterium]